MPTHLFARPRSVLLRAIVTLLVLTPCLRESQTARAQTKPVKKVLIVYEENPTYPAISEIDSGIRDSFDNSHYTIEFYSEYMDTLTFPASAEQQQFRDFFVHRYTHERPDVIITVGPSPLRFMTQVHQKLFPDVPIVFCLPNGPLTAFNLDSEFTGAAQDIAPAQTIESALHLFPGMRHLVIVGGVTAYDRQEQSVVRSQLQGFEKRLDISYLTDLAMPEILERLRHLPSQTAVLLITVGQDAAGTRFTSVETGPLISSAANAPVFSLFDVYLNHGEVGGDVSNISRQGTIAGNMALRILGGEKPQNIPIARDVTTYEFDWRALRRWGLRESNLPPDSVILNRPLSPWEAYRRYIIAGVSLIVLETVLLYALLLQRLRRRKAEGELATAYDRLRLALETGRSVVWDWDAKSGKDRWFGDLQTIFGIPSDTYVGRVEDFHRRLYPDDRQLVSKAVANARLNRTPYVAEFRVVRENDQSVRWISARGKFYYGKNGEAVRMLGTAVDVTERKQAEQKLRESEERFRLVANRAPVMIWMSGTDKVCNYLNETWLEFTGRPIEAELNDGWAAGVHAEDIRECLKTYEESFDKRVPFKMQYRLRRHDGAYRWVLDTGVPRFNADGSFAGYIGSCMDVTDRKVAEETLSSVGRRLIEAHEEERTWIARELHDDISQAIAVVAGELGRATQEPPSAATIDAINHAWDRLAEIANDVQGLSHRLHSSKLEYLGIAAAAQSFCKELAGQKNVKIDFTQAGVPRTLPKEISLCLFRILQEALQNAVKYSGGQEFNVELQGTAEQVVLTVSDSGRGFDQQEAMSRQGLGLISMRERAHLVGGELSIRSEVGHGTTVSVRIPLAASRAAAG
jgi:PAS domain S-box-containing protein